MSDRSANLSLPYIQPSQAQKHVTHNEAVLLLDALVQLSVLSATTVAEPGAPADGDRYILPAGATGAWSGHDGDLAVRTGDAWLFLTPLAGWAAWVADTGSVLRHDGTTWQAEVPSLQNVPMLGVNATADATNRLAVASAASLLTHAGAGHQIKVNKAQATDTASLLFQTGWSGRAEMGTVGSDAFGIKVSDDGASFRVAISADPATGAVDFPNGATGLTDPALGGGAPVPQAYVLARGDGVFTNGLGDLGTGYNYPAGFVRDTAVTPDLAAAFRHEGYGPGAVQSDEIIPVDPNRCYRIACTLRQEGLAGDWSAYANEERHAQSIGIICLDSDGLEIAPLHHMRFKSGGVDSLTTLSAPLTPGDTQVQVTDASGWNDSDPDAAARGLILFGYRSAGGVLYDRYSRIAATDLFLTAGVNKGTGTISLTAPLPAALGNPDDVNGTWPAGTPLANTAGDTGPKRTVLDRGYLAATDSWYRATAHVGGIDLSGTDVVANFAPGTTGIRLAFIPNETNQPGGIAGHPDTGGSHAVWFAGVSVTEAPLAVTDVQAAGIAAGSRNLYAPEPDIATGQVLLVAAVPTIAPL